MFGNGLVQFIICVSLEILGTIIFSYVVQKIINFTIKKIAQIRKRQDLQKKAR